MKIRNPSVGTQPVRTPEFEARGVAPRGNLMAEATNQFGDALQGAGQTILRVEDILQQRLDRAKTKEGDAKLADGYRELLSPDKGFRGLVGRAALDRKEGIIKDLDAHRERILSSLTPMQREMIADSDASLYQQARGTIDGHYSQQLTAYEIGESEARANGLMTDALEGAFLPSAPDVPEMTDKHGEVHYVEDSRKTPQPKANPFEQNRTSARAELTELAALRGYGPDKTAELLQKADDTLHSAVLGRLVDGHRALDAAAHLDKYGSQLSPGARLEAQELVREAGTKEQAEFVAVDLLRQEGSITTKLDKLEEFHKSGHVSVEVKLAAEQRLLHMSSARRADQERGEAQALTEAQNWLTLNKGQTLPKAMADKLGSLKSTLDVWVAQGNQFITTAGGAQRAASITPDVLAKIPSGEALLQEYGSDLSVADRSSLLLRWASAHGKALAPKDAVELDHKTAVQTRLFRSGFYASFAAGDKTVEMREKAILQAITLRAKGSTNADWLAAEEEVFTKTARVFRGKLVPAVALTEEELKESKLQSQTVGGTLTDLDPVALATGPDGKGQRAAPSVDLPGGVFRLGSATLPTGDEVIAALQAANGGRLPGDAEIARVYEEAKKEAAQLAADTQEAAGLEKKVRREAALSAYRASVARETLSQLSTDSAAAVLEEELARKEGSNAVLNETSEATAARRAKAAQLAEARRPSRKQAVISAAHAAYRQHANLLQEFGIRPEDAFASTPDIAEQAPELFAEAWSEFGSSGVGGVALPKVTTEERDRLTELKTRYKPTASK